MPSYLTPGVYVEEVQSGARPIEGVGTAVAAFVGFAETGPFHRPTLVTSWDQYVSAFGTFTPDTYLTLAVHGYFSNGGGAAYIVRIGGPAEDAPQGSAPAAAPPVALGGFLVSARPGAGDGLSIEVADPEGENPPEDRFRLLVRQGGKVVETYDTSVRKNVKGYLVTQARQSKLVEVTEQPGAAQTRPENQSLSLSPAAPAAAGTVRSGPSEYVGDASARTGIAALEAIDEITMIAVPDLMSAHRRGDIDDEGVRAVQLAVIAHCEQMGDRVAVLDTPPGMNAQRVRAWRNDDAGYDSRYATVYYPWLKVLDPATGQQTLIPPSGHVAGCLGAQRRRARGAQGARQRGHPRGAGPGTAPEQGRAGPAQPDRRQLRPRLPRPRHPHLGRTHALVRPRLALPERACGSSTTWRSPSSWAPSGSSSSRTTTASGRASAATSPPSSPRNGAGARSSAGRRRRPSTSSATGTTTRRSPSTSARSCARSASPR